jgi:peroxiredoxin family protein
MKSSQPNHDDDDYEVGYGRPPKHSQFKKGMSGNSSGRPKKLKSMKEQFALALAKEVVINGKKVTKQELFVEMLIQHAVKGKPVAMRMVMELLALSGDDEIKEFDPAIADENALTKWIMLLETQKSDKDVP